MTFEPTIVRREAFVVAGMRITTSPMARDIPALWQAFAPRMHEVAAVAEPRVSYGLMENFDQVHGRLDYMAAVSVLHTDRLPSSMEAVALGPSTYAVFAATLDTMGAAYDFIFNAWLQRGGFERAEAPHFERYGEDFDPADPASVVAIHIPVKPRAA